MSNVLVYNLEDYLPLYSITKDNVILNKKGFQRIINSFETRVFEEVNQAIKDELNSEDEESDKCPDWVKENIKLGALGEKLVMNYLSDINLDPKQVSTVSSSYGYDIIVKKNGIDVAYEVKTTSRNEDRFYISYNELKIASRMQSRYNLFIINIEPEYKNINGFIIQDPIKALNIDFSKITEIVDNENIEVIPTNFRIHLKQGIVGRCDVIDMIRYKY